MSFTNAQKYYKYKKEQEKLREYYLSVGMSEDMIAQIFDFDDEVFRSDNRFNFHNQYIESCLLEDEDVDGEGLVNNLRDNFIIFQDFSELDILYWINEIEDPEIFQCLKKASKLELILLTLVLIKQAYSQKEMSNFIGLSQQEVSRKIKNICERIRNCKNDL